MFRALLILIVGGLLLTCLLTPVVYGGLELLMGTVPWPYSRVFDRVAMLALLIFLIVLRKDFNLTALTPYFRRGGFSGNSRSALLGALLAFSGSIVLVPLVISGTAIIWDDRSFDNYLWRMIKVIPAAFLVSVIEESFFRVLLLNKLKERFAFGFAALVSSLLYGVAHFITPVKSFTVEGFSLLSGFVYMGSVFERLASFQMFPAFFGLTLVGLVLCVVIQRSNSIWPCIGLHAGWVMAVKATGYLTTTAPDAQISGALRRYFLVSQPVSWGVIVLIGVCALILFRDSGRSSA